MGNADPAQEWSTYPKNLEGLNCASWDYDYSAYHDDFLADSRRLFCESGQIRVRILEVGHNGGSYCDHKGFMLNCICRTNLRQRGRAGAVP